MSPLGGRLMLAFLAVIVVGASAALFEAVGAQNEAQAATLTYTPTRDARVEEASASTNYGGSTILRTDGGAGARMETYLQFAVTNIPAGERITSAKLRVYDTDNGTADGPAVYTSSTGWSESTIT
jgi:hypothetical protein